MSQTDANDDRNRSSMNPACEEVGRLNEMMNRLILAKQELLRKAYSHWTQLDEMTKSLGLTIQSLSDENSEARLLGLLVLDAFYLDVDQRDLLPQFEKLAFSDPDDEVREFAIRVVGLKSLSHSEPVQRAIGLKISQVVLDEAAKIEYRKAAYRGLCRLSEDYDVRAKGDEDPAFPMGIDWVFVRSWQQHIQIDPHHPIAPSAPKGRVPDS